MPKFCVDCVHFAYNKDEIPELNEDEGICARDANQQYDLVFGEKYWTGFKDCKKERTTEYKSTCGFIGKYYKILKYGGKSTYNNYVDSEQPQ